MRFESRNLKPYSEPVCETDLEEGEVYFFLNYIDTDMLFPQLESVVFIGHDLEPEDADQVYFQDLCSYREGARYHSGVATCEANFYSGSRHEVGHVFKFEKALESLMGCALRRKKKLSSG